MPYFASYVYGLNNPLTFVDPSGLTACGPIGSDCNGANLVPLFLRYSRELNDTAYLNLWHSLTEEQADEIGFDDLSYIHLEAENRQMHQMACEASPGQCWPPCPEQGYDSCQMKRVALGFVLYFLAPMVFGAGVSAVLGRACAADLAAAARTTAANSAAGVPRNALGQFTSGAGGDSAAAAAGRSAHASYPNTLGWSGDDLVQFNQTMPGSTLRPDAINWTQRVVGELKPANPSAISAGWRQVNGYKAYLEELTGQPWTAQVDVYTP
jgi:hypothetical protein